MTFNLKPETQTKLTVYAAALGVSVDEFLEALVAKELPSPAQDAPPISETQFQREHGIWVFRTGQPMPVSLIDDTLDAIRCERENSILGLGPQ